MHVVRAAQAVRFQVPGVEFAVLAGPATASGELCAWQITVAPGLESAEAHTLDRDEVFMVTAGSISLRPGDAPLLAGDAAVVPAGTPIRLSNPGATPARANVAVLAGFSATAADGSPLGTPPWAR